MPEFTQNQHVYIVQPVGPARLFTPVATILMSLLLAGSSGFSWFGNDFLYYLGLNHPQVMGWKIWQFYTYSFIDCGWLMLIVDICIILFFGGAVERVHNSKTVALFFAVTIPLFGLIALPFLIWFPRIPWLAGGDTLLFGSLGLFAYSFRKQKMMMYFWVVEADKAAWLLVFLNGVAAIFGPMRLIFIPAAFAGWWYMKLRQQGKLRIPLGSSSKSAGPAANRSEGFVDVD